MPPLRRPLLLAREVLAALQVLPAVRRPTRERKPFKRVIVPVHAYQGSIAANLYVRRAPDDRHYVRCERSDVHHSSARYDHHRSGGHHQT
jgi:hypothetical protein